MNNFEPLGNSEPRKANGSIRLKHNKITDKEEENKNKQSIKQTNKMKAKHDPNHMTVSTADLDVGLLSLVIGCEFLLLGFYLS